MENFEISGNQPVKKEISPEQELEIRKKITHEVLEGANGDDLKKAGFDLQNPAVRKGIITGISATVDRDEYSDHRKPLAEKLKRLDLFEFNEEEKQEALVEIATDYMKISGPTSLDDYIPYGFESHYAQKIIDLHPEIKSSPEFKSRIKTLVISSWHFGDDVSKQLVNFTKKNFPTGFDIDSNNSEDEAIYETILDRARKGEVSDTKIFSPVIRFSSDFFKTEEYKEASQEGYCHLLSENPNDIKKNNSAFVSLLIDPKFKETPEYHQAIINGYKHILGRQYESALEGLSKYEKHYKITDKTIHSPEIEETAINSFITDLKKGNIFQSKYALLSDRYHIPEVKLSKREISNVVNESHSFENLLKNTEILNKLTPLKLRERLVNNNEKITEELASKFISQINKHISFLDSADKFTEKYNLLKQAINSGLINEKAFKSSLELELKNGTIDIQNIKSGSPEVLYQIFDYFKLENCCRLGDPPSENINPFSLIYSQEFAPKTVSEFLKVEITNMPQGMTIKDLITIHEHEYSYSIKSYLRDLTRLSFHNEIMPVINAQGDASFHYLSQICDYQKAHEDDFTGLQYVAYVGKKYGVEASNIYENLLSKIGPVGEKRDLIERYLSEIHLPSQEIFKQYEAAENSGNWQEIEAIKEKVAQYIHETYYGIASEESYKDEIFLSVNELFFPPAITALHEAVKKIYTERPDRRYDVPQSLDILQYEKISVETGKYLLGDQKLDTSPWNEIKKITQEVNENITQNPQQSSITSNLTDKIVDYFLNPKDNSWPWPEKYRDLYTHYLSLGNSPVEDFDLTSRSGLMSVTEFVEDTIKVDVLQNIIDDLKATNPEKYQKLEGGVVMSAKNDWNKDVSLIKSLVSIVKKSKDEEQKEITLNRLEVTLQKYNLDTSDVMSNDDSWKRFVNAEIVAPIVSQDYRTENYYNSPEFISSLERFEEKRSARKRITDKLSGSLFRDVSDKMHKELSKFKFVSTMEKETQPLEFIVSKKKEHCIAGLNMGVCVSPDKELWDDPTFMNCIFLDPEVKRANGGVHFLIREDYLTLPGINPSLYLLGRVNQEILYDKIIDYSKEVAHTLGLKGVLIPTSSAIHSNRDQIQEIIKNKKYPKINLQKEASFSYSPHRYSFQECFVV